MGIGSPVVGLKDDQIAVSGSSAPSWPNPIGAGDFVLEWGLTGAAVANVWTPPTGITEDAENSSTGNTLAPSVMAGHKTTPAAGTETGTLPVTHTSVITTVGLIAFPGVHTLSPIAVGPVLADPGTAATTLTWPSQTVVTPGSCLVVVASGNSTSVVINGLTVNGVAGSVLDNRTKTSARSGGVAWFPNLAAGATGSIVLSWSGSSQRSLGLLYILNPAPSGSPFQSPTARLLPYLTR